MTETISFSERDWRQLETLRAEYLTGAVSDWSDASTLDLYHQSFGQRIAWKWRAVLAEPAVARLAPAAGPVVDLGCGSGVASLECHAAGAVPADADWHLLDRSAVARAYATDRLAEIGVRAHSDGRAPQGEIGTLIVSHVLSELDEKGLDELVALASRASRVLVVEPGSRPAASELVALRERLRAECDDLVPVAPCPHSGACGLRAPNVAANEGWCHHFAPPAPEAFTSGFWRRFSKRLGIDLRDLPMSFLVLARPDQAPAAASDDGLVPARILGRPRVEKGRVRFELCWEEGVIEADLLKRTDPVLFRGLREPEAEPRAYRVELGARTGDATRVTRIEPATGSDTPQ
ncbi:Mitochondrial small ribosomal subunit Rsm22 [Planctomycetes bacterium Pla163]|uniref:Mitochondrial small ribosomal subunit Rsm22 n=1 Tax=Rohdeia mirabilis TaxID=2528008 RepID=A0A518CY28_9BACT|nr:Mitochondrial small ribosomal subunit Rsm22 [Planctomycetes bacterium Pla163]